VMPMRLNRVKHNRGIFRWEEKNEKIIWHKQMTA
jgi:hypothetical protein